MHSGVAVEISLSFPFEGKKWKEFCGSLKSSLRKQRIYCGWRHPADWVSGKENAQSSYSCMTDFFSVVCFPPFFSFFPALYTALPCSCPPPLPSWACPCSPACCVGFPPLCHSCVRWQQQSKIDWNADLRSTLAHSALEIRILVHYTRLLAEQSAVTGKHNAGARGSDSEF